MIITARQLEDLHRNGGSNGHLTLPYRARLTPLAADFIRARKLVIGYSDVDGPCGTILPAAADAARNKKDCDCGCGTCGDAPATTTAAVPAPASPSSPSAGAKGGIIYWCDGPSGPAKAALAGESKQSALRPLELPSDPTRIVAVVKAIAAEVKANRATAAILLVQNGAPAIVFANRCPSLRAVLGTCLEAVEQGLQQVAANVLVIEYPHRTLQQMKNLIGRFSRGGPALAEEVKRNFAELTSCG